MEMTDKLIIHRCESLTFRDKKLFLNIWIHKENFNNGLKILKNLPHFDHPRLKNQGRRIPSSDALGPFGGAIVLSLTRTTMPQIGRIAIPQSRRRCGRIPDIRAISRRSGVLKARFKMAAGSGCPHRATESCLSVGWRF
jgi:hypothetical protein